MLRVLHVFATMNRGGAESMIMNYYRAIDRSTVQFDFLVHTEEKCAFDDEIEQLDGQIFRISRFTGLNYCSYIKQLKSVLDGNRYRIVHIHFFSIAGVLLPIFSDLDVKIRIVHCHSANPNYSINFRILNYILKKISQRYVTDRFACGQNAGRYFFDSSDYIIVNNAIDVNQFSFNEFVRSSVRQELDVEERLVIGHVGRFVSVKNHDFMIKIFSEILKVRNDAILILVGDGPLRQQMEEKVVLLGLVDHVIFLGVRTDIPDLLHAMDVFLFPSLWEGFPVTLIEAQAAGLPCVVSSSITKDVRVTDLIDFISLNDSVETWRDAVLSSKKHLRSDLSDSIRNSGYDILENAKWLENWYLSKNNECN